MIMGNSGSGKTYSLKPLTKDEVSVISVEKSRLPFKTDIKPARIPDNIAGEEIDSYGKLNAARYSWLQAAIRTAPTKMVVIDDSQYMMAAELFDRAKEKGYDKFTDMAANFRNLIHYINNLPEDAKRLFAEYKDSFTPAQWAFRWLWNQPEVTVVLSGMNTQAMVLENVKSASEARVGEFGEEEQALLAEVVKAINGKVKVGCTGCAYCMPCPKGVDIPGTFSAYNRRYTDNWFTAMKEYFMCTTLRKNSAAASQCIGCGKCEKHCPQNIAIRKELQEVQKVLETPLYRVIKKAAGWFVHF